MLREARVRQRVSQRTLARRSGVAQSAISRIERGVESPSFERFEHLLSCLGLRAALGVEPIPYRGDPELLAAERELSVEERLIGAFNHARFARELRSAMLARAK